MNGTLNLVRVIDVTSHIGLELIFDLDVTIYLVL